jgi:poly-gamma-glutamate capsule biosynthesis protein CapA/YwtB (metallophosphatase superfamily)
MMSNEQWSIVAVGDIVPSRPLVPAETGLCPGFRRVVGLLQQSSLSFGDLEITFGTTGEPVEKFINFRSPTDVLPGLRDIGFGVVSLANNHSMDFGAESLDQTMAQLDSLGIRHVGAGSNLDEAERAEIIEVEGLKIGFLAWSCVLPPGSAAGPLRPGVAPLHIRTNHEISGYHEIYGYDLDSEEPGNSPLVRTHTAVDAGDLTRATRAVQVLRNRVDFVFMSVHWGYGSGEELAEYQRPLGHALIEAGADVVMGNHLHAVQGIEKYLGRAIVFSPGNFIAQQPRDGVPDLVRKNLDAMAPDGFITFLDIDSTPGYRLRLLPTNTNEDGLPEIADGESLTRIADKVIAQSALLGVEIRTTADGLITSFEGR